MILRKEKFICQMNQRTDSLGIINYVINVSSLESLGDRWPKENLNPKGLSEEQIADLQATAKRFNADGKLDNAISHLNKIDTSFSDAVNQFAQDNGFEYLGSIGSDYTQLGLETGPMPAWTRNRVLASMQEYAVRGQIGGYSVLMFVDKVATSYSGGNGSPSVPYFSRSGVVVVQLNKIFPQLVLDSNKNDKFFMKIRSAAIKKDQKIDLEGNFSGYFDFYSPLGINVNTLSVLAPNFMQILIDSSATFDVEIFGDKLFLTTQDPLFTARSMSEVSRALEEQLGYMSRLEQSWSYQPLKSPFDLLEWDVVENFYSIKIGGYRIGLAWLILVLFGIVFLASLLIPIFMS